MNRRNFLTAGAATAVASLVGRKAGATLAPATQLVSAGQPKRSRLKLSVSRWPYNKFTLEQLCVMSKQLGLDAIDLLEPDEWQVPLRHGLVCAMGYATVPHPEARLTDGFN